MKDNSEIEVCPNDDLAAYLDGELTAKAADAIEKHVDACDACGRALADQRRFLAALSASLDSGNEIVLPANFTKKIVSNAESSVIGLRRQNEWFTAVFIAVALFFFAIFALGGETFAVASAMGSIGEKFVAVGGFGLRLLGSLGFAVAVVARSLSSHLGAAGFSILFFVFICAAVIFASSKRMIRRRSA